METLAALEARFSCRKYQELPLSGEELSILLRAAMAAPAACGRYRELHISVIREGEFLASWDRAAAEAMGAPRAHPLCGAPLLLLISGFFGPETPRDNPPLNAGCAGENIALAAADRGLGSVLLAAPVRALCEREELLRRLELPEGFRPLLAVALGHPAAEKPRRKPHEIPVSYLDY